jgi:hypothetical protein
MVTSQLDLEALEAEIGRFLDGVAVAEAPGPSCSGCCAASSSASRCPWPTGPPA